MFCVSALLPPPTQESFLFIISSDSRGNDGESEKVFCQFLSVWQSEWSLACEEQEGILFFYLFTRWWKDGKGHRDTQREGEMEMTEGRRSLNPPVY